LISNGGVDQEIFPRSEAIIIDNYWHASFRKEDNIHLDTQSVFDFPDIIDYYIYITEEEFATYMLTEDSVLLVSYSDDVVINQISISAYTYTITLDGYPPITIETNRSTNAFGASGNYSYEMEFHSAPINLGYLSVDRNPLFSLFCQYLCCPACKKTHEILDIQVLDFLCCFYCSLCHYC
jgi:hypothetical protein